MYSIYRIMSTVIMEHLLVTLSLIKILVSSQAILLVWRCEDESQSAFPQALISLGVLGKKTEFK